MRCRLLLLFKVVLNCKSVDNSLVWDHSNETYWAVLSCGTVCCTKLYVVTFEFLGGLWPLKWMLLSSVFTHFCVYYCGTEDQVLAGKSLLLFQTTIVSVPCFSEVLVVSFINIHVFSNSNIWPLQPIVNGHCWMCTCLGKCTNTSIKLCDKQVKAGKLYVFLARKRFSLHFQNPHERDVSSNTKILNWSAVALN